MQRGYMMSRFTKVADPTHSRNVDDKNNLKQQKCNSLAEVDDNRLSTSVHVKHQMTINNSPNFTAQLKLMAALNENGNTFQRVAEEEELLQGKFSPIQQVSEEEELLQGKFKPIQCEEEEELLQGKFPPTEKLSNAAPYKQLKTIGPKSSNNTGMSDELKSGIENLSGMDMSDVRVHKNSSKPAQLNAHAFAQGSEIHLGAGQEKHLPHEAWHVVQQKQGRVKPTVEVSGQHVNDDAALENEADIMGTKALK